MSEKWGRRQSPKLDDVRVVRVFLLFPACIDGDCRWLEWAWVKQRYYYGAFENYWLWIKWEVPR